MDLQGLCDLWKYQHSQSRFTGFLKQKIEGYDNGRVYNIEKAKRQRQEWLNKIKYGNKDVNPELQKLKKQYLEKLIHPENRYVDQKPEWANEVERYGANDPLLKTYKCAAKDNLLPNQVNFKLFLQFESVKERQKKLHVNFVQDFYNQFGEILVQQSPQFWKTLMYQLLERLYKFKDSKNDALSSELFTLVPNEKLIKYLVTFKNDICSCLDQMHFFQKSIDGIVTEPIAEKKKGKDKQKEKSAKWIHAEDEALDQVNFLKMTNQQITQKVPTLKRIDQKQYIQFRLQPPPKLRKSQTKLVKISQQIHPIYKSCFQSDYLNQIQSIVFEQAYRGVDNMLICAPTGAGKTNIATLAIINAINRVDNPAEVRIVYISPMKALASQLVYKFNLKFPHHKIRQSTGDIQLSQRELATTNILVTTPQKFDVTTRKGGSALEGLHLLILDEVHLLNDDRGWVLESIVARLFRTSERTQRRVRLVGLSATLPNYLDVADFLRVPRQTGLFHFDSTFRPVPLLIHFIGVKNPKDVNNNIARKRNIRDIYNQKCYDIVLSHLRQHKQVLVFVHSRRQTVRYCEYVLQRSKQLQHQHHFHSTCSGSKLNNLRDKILHKCITHSVGFHHAGMVRGDRDVVQKYFQSGDVKMLVATATLAWGVNLPAYAVIIKGTDIYDPNMTESRDLSILDVQQMFGRAGRPQYDVSGQAVLMTDHAKINHYIGTLTNSSPIDSKFLKHIKQALNAEIVSGTVTSEDEAFDWLKYTFLAVRLKRCPEVYGCARGTNEAQKELYYDQFIRRKIKDVLDELDRMKLIRLDHKSLSVNSTQIGRVTSHYYIKCQTMEHLCSSFHIFAADDPNFIKKRFDFKSDLDILNILSNCAQFQSISPRLQEMDQLKLLMKYWILEEQPDFLMKKDRFSVNLDDGPVIDKPQKVLLLLQGYLRQITYKNFSLVNDTQYVVQNSIRLLRCMLDLCSKKSQAQNVRRLLCWCKYIQSRVFRDDSPIKQFTKFSFSGYNAMRAKKQMDGFLSNNLYEQFANANISIDEYLDQHDNSDRSVLFRKRMNNYALEQLKRYCQYIPRVDVKYTLKPIAQTILKVDMAITPRWRFNPKWHLKSQVFWVLFDDQVQLLHSETFTIEQEFVVKQRQVNISFYVRYKGKQFNNYRLLITSDRWMNQHDSQRNQKGTIYLSLQNLGIQMDTTPFTQLLDLQPLPITALKNPIFQQLYNFKFFNPIQTQVFFSLYQTNKNILIGAPTGSGKTIMSELAIFHQLKQSPQKKIVYVAPLKALVRQRIRDWEPRFRKIKKSVVQLSGDFTPDIQSLNKADIIITTPEKWDGITRSNERQYTKKVGLIIFDQIHLLGQERGAVLEVIVSRMNKQRKIRMIGLSTAMANGTDVSEWFGTDSYGFFNFRPSVRPVPIQIHFEGFSQKHYCPRMGTMNKPAYNHIKKFSDGKPVIVFVSSRRQTRLTASDLIAYCQMQNRQRPQYILCDQRVLQRAIQNVHDQFLKQTLCFGIALHHAGLDNSDRQLCEQLFVKNHVQVMIATSTLAWGVNFPARLVLIKGTQYFDAKSHKYVDFQSTDLLQMIGRAGRPQFDDRGVAVVYCEASKKNFYRKFLNDPFPIESSLLEQLSDHINAQIARGQISNKQQCIEWITWSFLFRRILKNPNFYNVQGNQNEIIKSFLNKTVTKVFKELKDSGCIETHQNQQGQIFVMPTELGFIASSYYLKNNTVKKFNDSMKQSMEFEKLLRLMSDAEQFKETPLRHNEDIHNKQLSSIAPFKAKNFSSPQEKTLLLLQMHLFNLPYPIRDYLNDCKLILDSCGRVIMGLIQIAKNKRFLDTVMTCIRIQQSIYQGFTCNVPYITHDVWLHIQKKFDGLAGIVQGLHFDNKFEGKFVSFLKEKLPQFGPTQKEKILKGFKSHPVMKLNVQSRGYDSQNNIEKGRGVQEGGQALLNIAIQKQNNGPNRLIIQKHTKIKDVTWWVLVGDAQNRLLALKKISVKKRVQLKVQVDVPEDLQKNPVSVYLMADSYIGLDQVQKVGFKIIQE